MTTANRLSRNTLILLVSNIGSALLLFALSAIIGRAYGKEGLGVYSTAMAWVFPLSLIAEFGLNTLLTREIARQPERERAYLTTAVQARLWIAGGLALALIIIAPLLSRDALLVQGIRISAPLILVLPLFGTLTAIFRARQVMWPIPWLNLGMLVAQLALTAWAVLSGGDILLLLIVNTFTSIAQLGAAWLLWRRLFHVTSPTGSGSSHSITSILWQAWPFAVAAILAAVQTRLGTILLEQMADTTAAGSYAAAARFVEAGRMIPNALFGALFPALAALAQQPTALNNLFRKILGLLASFGLLAGIVCTLFASTLITLTYGSDFTDAAPILTLSMWSLLPSLLRSGIGLYWYAVGRESWVNRVTIIALLIQFVLSLLLIPAYGGQGAASAIVLTETISTILLGWPLRTHHARR